MSTAARALLLALVACCHGTTIEYANPSPPLTRDFEIISGHPRQDVAKFAQSPSSHHDHDHDSDILWDACVQKKGHNGTMSPPERPYLSYLLALTRVTIDLLGMRNQQSESIALR